MTDRKTDLLDLAEHAARSRGVDAFSYGDLAAQIGIKTASIHYHFPTKAILSTALMQRYHDNFATICARINVDHNTGGQRLAALIDRYRHAHHDATQVCLCVAFSISRESLPADVIHQIEKFRAMMRHWIGAAFEQGNSDGTITNVHSPASEAAATLSLLEGAQLSARATQDAAAFDDAIALLEQRIQ